MNIAQSIIAQPVSAWFSLLIIFLGISGTVFLSLTLIKSSPNFPHSATKISILLLSITASIIISIIGIALCIHLLN